jgi:hypothetical protein
MPRPGRSKAGRHEWPEVAGGLETLLEQGIVERVAQ